jgi:hypothetical protein
MILVSPTGRRWSLVAAVEFRPWPSAPLGWSAFVVFPSGRAVRVPGGFRVIEAETVPLL